MRYVLKTLALIGLLVLPVHAQESGEAAPAAAEDAAPGAQAAEQERPEMPGLFFRQEQRRILEAVRQGIVGENDFEIEEVAPIVSIEEVLPDPVLEDEGLFARRQRGSAVNFDAYLINRKSGKGVIWMNGSALSIEEDAALLERQGFAPLVDKETLSVEGGFLEGADAYSESNFQVKVGQTIDVDGRIEENLPVIRINKK